MMPRSGGQYNFIGAAFGRVWAFLFGWMETLVDGAASVAAIAIVFIIFLNDLLGGTLSFSQIQLLTVGTIAAVTLLTLASMHTNGLVASIVTGLKVLLVAGIGIAAFLFSDGSWTHYTASGAAGACAGVSAGAGSAPPGSERQSLEHYGATTGGPPGVSSPRKSGTLNARCRERLSGAACLSSGSTAGKCRVFLRVEVRWQCRTCPRRPQLRAPLWYVCWGPAAPPC